MLRGPLIVITVASLVLVSHYILTLLVLATPRLLRSNIGATIARNSGGKLPLLPESFEKSIIWPWNRDAVYFMVGRYRYIISRLDRYVWLTC